MLEGQNIYCGFIIIRSMPGNFGIFAEFLQNHEIKLQENASSSQSTKIGTNETREST